MRLFNIVMPNGRLGGCSSSIEHARREIEWFRASGVVGQFSIEEVERDSEWGAPRRPGFVWCSAKIAEFHKRYAAREPIFDLAIYFDTSEAQVCKRARTLGFGYRIEDPATFERHRGRWTEREFELINLMYDEGIGTSKIPQHVPRTESAIKAALRATAARLSTRSQFGRFIAAGKPGRKKTIHRVLEEAGEPDLSGEEVCEESPF